MNKIFSCSCIWLLISTIGAAPIFSQTASTIVSSQSEFDTAVQDANAGDSIVWTSGTYHDIFLDIDKDGIIVTAEENGGVVFTGSSRVEIPADLVQFSGFQFIAGDIGTEHVIRIDGSDVFVTQINIQDYTSYKYLIIDELSQRVTVSYSNFENRINLDDQNILSILVDDDTPGYHKVQYCSFKNFEGTGNDMGVEPVRIGVSTQSEFISGSIIEYCYFTQCDGDGELISNKAAKNVMRYNTFQNNAKAELVLRHGNQGIVYGNFFLNNMGGIRVREGSDHFIYNNYFEGLDRRSIYLQNEASDPLENIHIYFNTIVNSAEVLLGGDGGSNPPKNVVLANNIFSQPESNLFEDATGAEDWIGNISKGSLGITRPPAGLSDVDPKLETNENGFQQLGSDSPAIDAAESGYSPLPEFDEIDIDPEILLDLMKQTRPELIELKDVGAVEYAASVVVTPHVDESNTGPAYLTGEETVILATEVIGNGSIVLDPPSGLYPVGTSVLVTAIPGSGGVFVEWSGAATGSTNPETVTLNDNSKIVATFSPVLSIDDISEDVGLHLFPNPASNQLNIEISVEDFIEVEMEVYTISGEKTDLHLDGNYGAGVHTLRMDISRLPDGVYFVRFKKYDHWDSLILNTNIKFIKD